MSGFFKSRKIEGATHFDGNWEEIYTAERAVAGLL